MNDLQKITFVKGLNTDDDPLFLQPGEYDAALNVRHLTGDTQSTKSIVPIKGNQFATLIPPTIAQSKVYAIAIHTGIASAQLRFSDINGTIVDTAAFPVNAGSLTTTFNADVKPVIQAALTSVGITSTVTLTTSDDVFGNVIITLTNRLGLDYTITSIGASELIVFVTQDAIDSSIAGKANVIGSYDLLGDLFIWSTSNIYLPETLTFLGTPLNITTIVGGGLNAVVTTGIIPHGLSLYQKVVISGNSNPLYNSTFIIIAVTSTTFTISNNFGNSTGGIITIYSTGVGEIGVVTYDPNLTSSNFTYTRLIKSTQLNFTTKKQIDTYIEQNNVEKSIYWTDDYNVPRVMYYKGAYIQDGFLSFYDSANQYELGTINQETILILSNTNFQFNFTQQYQVGGELLSGNWRYSFRFLTSSLVGTQWSELSNPIPVFKSDTGGTPSLMSGDDPNIITGKINEFSITGITPNLFQYIEMAAINYVGNAIVGNTVSRTLLNSNTSIILTHTGLETNVTSLDLGTLNQIQANIQTAKNICVVDNRLILSNLTTGQITDFSNWTKTWTHATAKLPINSVGSSVIKVAEYNDPNNVYNFVGYMDNEVYRFGAKFKLKNGTITDVFWIDDIRFDTSTTNINNETPNRRTGHFSTYDLTNSGGEITYVTYCQIGGIDSNFLIGGVKAKDLIDEIFIERAECVPEILCTGMAALSVTQSGFTPVASLSDTGLFYMSTPGLSIYYGEYPFTNSINDTPTTIPYPSTGAAIRTILSFYSPDILYNHNSLSFTAGDVIFNYGNPQIITTSYSKTGAHHYNSTYGVYNGYTNRTTATSLAVSAMSNVGFGSIPNLSPFFYSKLLATMDPYPFSIIGGSTINIQWAYIATPVIQAASLTDVSGFADYGFYYIQYKRPLTYSNPDNCKYDNRTLTKYIPTGATLTNLSGIENINIFGGDIFTQRSYIKTRFAASNRLGGVENTGFGGGVSFYSQNRVNTQLNKRHDNTAATWNFPYPSQNITDWLEPTAVDPIEPIHYNTGYNIINGINSFVSFDPNSPNQNYLPTRASYSNLKPQDSLVDNYRTFLPLNFLDLDAGFGEITHMANGNGELITWQPRKLQRQFFNTRGILQTQPSLSVLIGDGSVMSRPGQTLTVFGTQHKWSVIKGKSAQGNDTFYWINVEMRKAIRFGYDGTISLADIHGMTSFLANNLSWVAGKDTPADGTGICGVWNSRYAEAIWVVRGNRTVTAWSSGTTYAIGDHVSYTPGTFSTFNQTGEIYVSLTNSNTNHNPESSTSNWAVVPHTDNNYFNEYSLVLNEFKNAFTAFYSPLPKILMAWTDSYLSPRPVSDQGRLYIHDQGSYCTWYDGSLIVDGHIEGIYNGLPDEVKRFAALRANCDITPQRIDFTTLTQVSFLTSGEFTSRDGNHDSSIKRDSTGTGINDNDTSDLFGKYLKVKMSFLNGVYQKLYGIVVKSRIMPRVTNK